MNITCCSLELHKNINSAWLLLHNFLLRHHHGQCKHSLWQGHAVEIISFSLTSGQNPFHQHTSQPTALRVVSWLRMIEVALKNGERGLRTLWEGGSVRTGCTKTQQQPCLIWKWVAAASVTGQDGCYTFILNRYKHATRTSLDSSFPTPGLLNKQHNLPALGHRSRGREASSGSSNRHLTGAV